jgi:hypothetical protein
MTNTTNAHGTRYLAHCKACGCTTSTLARHVNRADAEMGAVFVDDKGESGAFGNLAIRCRKCGKARAAKAVRGTFAPEKKCNAKCLASVGHVCDCSCGGKNHGAGHDAVWM